MHYEGLLIAVLTFVIIGMFHPLVIKVEYHFSKKIWPVFAICGAVFIGLSIITESTLLGTIFGVLGASSLWSIKELFEQEKRVNKGWFPKKSHRNDKKDAD